ncbi:MAG: hypothetical protein QRY72_03095 [Candidatus Rhabdochlamydia sp.]
MTNPISINNFTHVNQNNRESIESNTPSLLDDPAHIEGNSSQFIISSSPQGAGNSLAALEAMVQGLIIKSQKQEQELANNRAQITQLTDVITANQNENQNLQKNLLNQQNQLEKIAEKVGASEAIVALNKANAAVVKHSHRTYRLKVTNFICNTIPNAVNFFLIKV